MPTVRQNIAYLYADHVRPRRKAIRRVALAALSILAAAALLETFLFNVNFFRSAGYDTVDLSGKLELQRAPDGAYRKPLPSITCWSSRIWAPRYTTCASTSIPPSPRSCSR